MTDPLYKEEVELINKEKAEQAGCKGKKRTEEKQKPVVKKIKK